MIYVKNICYRSPAVPRDRGTAENAVYSMSVYAKKDWIPFQRMYLTPQMRKQGSRMTIVAGRSQVLHL
ncbi:hypothetical protein, partial [uncultured Victivallis sp.]|uniref:hypothetical protein n=1 Tax=uncultured Victivallis sp. TaxID=354118 RepID=UPI002594C3AC